MANREQGANQPGVLCTTHRAETRPHTGKGGTEEVQGKNVEVAI